MKNDPSVSQLLDIKNPTVKGGFDMCNNFAHFNQKIIGFILIFLEQNKKGVARVTLNLNSLFDNCKVPRLV